MKLLIVSDSPAIVIIKKFSHSCWITWCWATVPCQCLASSLLGPQLMLHCQYPNLPTGLYPVQAESRLPEEEVHLLKVSISGRFLYKADRSETSRFTDDQIGGHCSLQQHSSMPDDSKKRDESPCVLCMKRVFCTSIAKLSRQWVSGLGTSTPGPTAMTRSSQCAEWVRYCRGILYK